MLVLEMKVHHSFRDARRFPYSNLVFVVIVWNGSLTVISSRRIRWNLIFDQSNIPSRWFEYANLAFPGCDNSQLMTLLGWVVADERDTDTSTGSEHQRDSQDVLLDWHDISAINLTSLSSSPATTLPWIRWRATLSWQFISTVGWSIKAWIKTRVSKHVQLCRPHKPNQAKPLS